MTKPERPPDEKRRRGRPRVEPHYQATTWLTEAEYDRLMRLARAQDTSLSAALRRLVILRVTDE